MQSKKIDQLIPALIKARGAFKPVVKDSINPHFKSKYADLESVIDATRQGLADNGLAIVQTFGGAPVVTLITTLYHASGQWVSGEQMLTPSKSDPQGYFAASTYARRGGVMAILGIAPEDDDGNGASKPDDTDAKMIAVGDEKHGDKFLRDLTRDDLRAAIGTTDATTRTRWTAYGKWRFA